MQKNKYLLNRKDLMAAGIMMDDETIKLANKVAKAQARKIERLLFPDTFTDNHRGFYTVQSEEICELRRELGY